MKKSKIFIGVFLILAISCDEIPLPTVERCTLLSDGAICTDKRLPEDQQEYEKRPEELRTYQCTNPEDFNVLLTDIEEKRKELAKLRKSCNL